MKNLNVYFMLTVLFSLLSLINGCIPTPIVDERDMIPISPTTPPPGPVTSSPAPCSACPALVNEPPVAPAACPIAVVGQCSAMNVVTVDCGPGGVCFVGVKNTGGYMFIAPTVNLVCDATGKYVRENTAAQVTSVTCG